MADPLPIDDVIDVNRALCDCLESLNRFDREIDSFNPEQPGALQEGVNALLAKLRTADE